MAEWYTSHFLLIWKKPEERTEFVVAGLTLTELDRENQYLGGSGLCIKTIDEIYILQYGAKVSPILFVI